MAIYLQVICSSPGTYHPLHRAGFPAVSDAMFCLEACACTFGARRNLIRSFMPPAPTRATSTARPIVHTTTSSEPRCWFYSAARPDLCTPTYFGDGPQLVSAPTRSPENSSTFPGEFLRTLTLARCARNGCLGRVDVGCYSVRIV